MQVTDIEFYTVAEKPFVDMAVFDRIAQATREEPHLLETESETLRNRYAQGLSMIGLLGEEIVFHTCLTPLIHWFELGGTWTREEWRKKGLNQIAYSRFLPHHQHRNILVTTTSEASLRVGVHFSFATIRRCMLPPEELAATCVCSKEKTGSENPMGCTLAWGEPQHAGKKTCWVRVTPETAARMRLQAAA